MLWPPPALHPRQQGRTRGQPPILAPDDFRDGLRNELMPRPSENQIRLDDRHGHRMLTADTIWRVVLQKVHLAVAPAPLTQRCLSSNLYS